MKNIPLFTSSYGLATLILREIAWNGRAYVLVREIWNDAGAALLEECRAFCRAAGAAEVFAAWAEGYETLPADHAYDILEMSCPKAALPVGALPLEPLRRENADAYLEIYQRCFRDVPSAASYDHKSLEPLYDEDLAWLVPVGEGYGAVAEISKAGLEGIAVLPEHRGLGYPLAATVLQMVPRPTVQLKVASTNHRALALYRRLGFAESGPARPWYRL